MAQTEEAGDVRFTRETGLAAAVADIAEPVLNDLGFALLRVKVGGAGGGTVQIMAERPDGTMSVDDCALVSRRLSPALDAYDPLPGRYVLEISSPGIDRPLVRLRDFADWAGYEAKVTLKEPVDGQKRFRGVVAGVENGEALLDVELPGGDRHTIGLVPAMIEDARLVLSDALLKAGSKQRKTD
ncbi:MAG: ribosome maturation factor RimP [Pseudomonadota bacterium]|nr:ribosome maturation factor RimP [Pseudomonadota bacterium]